MKNKVDVVGGRAFWDGVVFYGNGKGCVKSTNDEFVFVLYDNLTCMMITGDEPYTAQATYPKNLDIIV